MIRRRAGRPVKVGNVVIIPLEHLSVAANGGEGIYGYASLRPLGIAVLTPEGVSVLNETGEPVPSDSYLEEVEGLREAINRS
jgi:hypothetical protein